MADARPQDTPTLAQVIKGAIESRLADLHVSMPGLIDSYDKTTGMATVIPCLQRRYANDDVVDLPPIKNVPIVWPRGGGAVLTFDLQKNDEVTLVFGERSLDGWKTTGGAGIDPGDPRKHALSDAVAFPGGTSKANPPSAATVTAAFTALGLKVSNKTGYFQFKDNADVDFDTGSVKGTFGAGGKVKFANADGELIATISKLVADLVQLLTDIQAATTVTMLGPEPLVMPTFATDLATLNTDKATLDTFKA